MNLNSTGFSEEYSRYMEIDQAHRESLEQQLEKPKSLAEFKTHPLFCLESHIGKYQAVHPQHVVMEFKEQKGYFRSNLHNLHSLDKWLENGRELKSGSAPIKIVDARVSKKKQFNADGEKRKTELYGRWQTKVFEPAVAENGEVPKNSYGNVYLFHPWMLPVGTTHLPYDGISKYQLLYLAFVEYNELIC